MAAAVAKAQEKNRVPESPQVLRLFLTQDTQRENPTEPSYRDWSATILSLSRTRYWQDFLGVGGGEDDKQKTKPKYRTISKFSKPLQTTCLGWGERTTELRHQTLKHWGQSINRSSPVFFLVPRRWSCKIEWAMTTRVQHGAVFQSRVTSQPCIRWMFSKASMHVLYPESLLLFSVTKDIRIKLILYYQTLYTTEVANNTELKNAIFFNILTFLSSATQESTVQNNNLKLTRTVAWSIKGYTVSTKQPDRYSLLHVAKPLATRGEGHWGLTNWGWRDTPGLPFMLLNCF